MWQVVHSNFKFLVFIGVIAIFSMVSAVSSRNQTMAQEPTKHNNMRELLETLKAKIKAEPGFEVIFKFSQPLMDNDEVNWTVPYSPQGEDIYRTIGEVGDDFVCFTERAGSSAVERCTPFSNIVRFGYLDD
jgi:hypothetical protein